MIVKGQIKTGAYFDSVSLMLIAKEANMLKGIEDSGLVMGTAENKQILKMSSLFLDEFEAATDSDLIVVVKAVDQTSAEEAFTQIEELFKAQQNKKDDNADFVPKSLDGALKLMPEANISLISVAGRYAAGEAMKALKKGMHVMLFSDNVSIEDEKKLKEYAIRKGLLVMGPDCGTAIINGVPLAFSNKVNKGDVGIVAASGTGLQEVSCVISNQGAGISQAIGTGGRDVKKEIGGLMFIESMRALNADQNTKVIVLISKPPHEEVLAKIANEIRSVSKPVVGIFIGGDTEIVRNAGAIPAGNLYEAGVIAAALSRGESVDGAILRIKEASHEIEKLAVEISESCEGKYLRGLFSGGTLCDEAQLILKSDIGYVYSNASLNEDYNLKDIWKSRENTIIDMGEDEFTVGRPHPMIDFSLRNKRIIQEASDSDVALILLDVVLGYGAHKDPAGELAEAIREAIRISPKIKVICSITGTENDPQDIAYSRKTLQNAGAMVLQSNAVASLLCGRIVKKLSE